MSDYYDEEIAYLHDEEQWQYYNDIHLKKSKIQQHIKFIYALLAFIQFTFILSMSFWYLGAGMTIINITFILILMCHSIIQNHKL